MRTENTSPSTRRKTAQHEPVKASLIPGAPLGKLAFQNIPSSVLAAEVVLLPAIFLVIGYWFSPQDPLWVTSEFPWSLLAPVLIALRYGALAGLGSTVVLLAGWFFLFTDELHAFPQIYFLGGLVAALLAGEFSSLWRAQIRRAEMMQHYQEQRLEHLVRQYYLLRLSHDRLEQELIGRPMAMRDALQKLQSSASSDHAPEQLLQLLAQYCQINVASLHAIHQDQIQTLAIAQLGTPRTLDLHDPLILQALKAQTLCHVTQTTSQQHKSRYLIAAPLLDLAGTPYALLVVEEMPFFALQTENLQALKLLLKYYTDGMSAQALAHPLLEAFPQCPEPFAVEMQRLAHMFNESGVHSVLVALEFSSDAVSHQLPEQIVRMKRMLDEYWLMEPRQGRQMLAVLMPLSNAATAEGFIDRLERWIQTKQGCSLADAGVYPHVWGLHQDTPIGLLQQIDGLRHA